VEKEWYQVSELVDEALHRRRNLTTDRQIDLHVPADLPPLYADGRELEVVLINLIENAVKYSDPDTTITLEVEHQDDQVVLALTDQGVGIPADHLEHIFERFYRVNRGGHRTPGTGLGLAICKRIVETHGGRIWVESSPGVGSRFCVSLPVDGSRQLPAMSPQTTEPPENCI
jgi:two-component system sensor histidine kinase KdpD